ncbi:MAG: hypothetical protein QXV17_12740 [Candidatus Micrarchaeaceae archaeon]
MKTSTLIIAIIGIAIIGYIVNKYIYLPKIISTTTTPSTTIPSTTPSNSTTSTATTSPSSSLFTTTKTSQIAYAQKIACQRFPQLCAKEAPYLFSGNGPVTAMSPLQSSSSSSSSAVHQSNPSTISTGIGKYIRPMGGTNLSENTVNRNSYSYQQEIENTNKPFMKKVSAITTTTQPQKTTYSSSSFTIHRPGLPTLSELKKQNPYLR